MEWVNPLIEIWWLYKDRKDTYMHACVHACTHKLSRDALSPNWTMPARKLGAILTRSLTYSACGLVFSQTETDAYEHCGRPSLASELWIWQRFSCVHSSMQAHGSGTAGPMWIECSSKLTVIGGSLVSYLSSSSGARYGFILIPWTKMGETVPSRGNQSHQPM